MSEQGANLSADDSERSGLSDDTPFEAAYSELERVVRQLEEDELSLEASISLYERGQALAQFCQDLLDRAELRIEQLDPAGSSVKPWGGEGSC